MKVKSKCTKSESAIQRLAVKLIGLKTEMKGAVVIANPLSEVPMHHNSEAAKYAAIGKAKAEGWRKNQADLIIVHKKNGFSGLAIELKRQKNDPLRPFRNTGEPWIDASKSGESDRVKAQAHYLHQLREQGFYACFAAGEPQLLDILDQWCKGTLRHEEYRFSYSLDADCMIYRV